MLTLTATTSKSEGDINIPVLDPMTNEQMAKAIISSFTTHFHPNVVKRTKEVKEYVKQLNNDAQRQFVDPCYDVIPQEECFICSFDFK